MISPVKELQSARKTAGDDRTDRSLPPSRDLEGFLDEAVPSWVLKALWGLGENGWGRDGMRRDSKLEEKDKKA